MNTIGYRIRCAREALGVTQEQLGKICGTTKQTIFKYENDIITNIPMDRLMTIAQHLRVSPAQLMGWSDTPHPAQTPAQSLSPAEQDLIRKFRRLDERGRSAVINTLDHEYTALTGEETNSLPRQA